MKSKVDGALSYPMNNRLEIRVSRDNRTVRTYTAYYTEPTKAYRLAQLFFKLNQLVGYRLVTDRITWWEHLKNDKS